MSESRRNIALIYFSRNPLAECRDKQFIPDNDKNVLLAATLINRSKRVAINSGLPLFHFHEGNQQGATFGERLTNAFKHVFDRGFTAAVAVGNDTPELGSIDWSTVCASLQHDRQVVGPSFRGGAYPDRFDQSRFQGNGIPKITLAIEPTL